MSCFGWDVSQAVAPTQEVVPPTRQSDLVRLYSMHRSTAVFTSNIRNVKDCDIDIDPRSVRSIKAHANH